MIFHGLKAIMLHVERTGGMARRKILKRHNRFKLVDLSYFAHATSTMVKKRVGHIIWGQYFTFVFVRNPWDRLLSLYFHYCTAGKRTRRGPFVRKFVSFTEYVMSVPKHTKVSQYSRTVGVDRVFRFEEYEKSMRELCKRLRIPYTLVRFNGTKHRNYTEYYTPETIQLVAKYSKIDIETFGYQFGK